MKKIEVIGKRGEWNICETATVNGKHSLKVLDTISNKYTAERCATVWRKELKENGLLKK